ncbi:MAG TPA: SNF2-related protein [Planctomycetaceae bacterium]|nr:SNF2-related protein [Planctomycetaceae bacterium]
MSLSKRCAEEFNRQDWARGVEYFESGAVSITAQSNDGLEALVRGSRRSPYRVRLDWTHAKESRLHVNCTCPRFEDIGVCKHLAATILAADAQNVGPIVPGKKELLIFSDDEDPTGSEREFAIDMDEEDEDWEEAVEPEPMPRGRAGYTWERKTYKRTNAGSSARQPNWRQRLSALADAAGANSAGSHLEAGAPWSKPREIWYLLNVPRTLSRGRPCLSLRQCVFKKDGTRGKLKTATLMPTEATTLPLAEDRELLQLLAIDQLDPNGFMYGATYNSNYIRFCDFAVAPALFETLLPRLCASRRFGWLPDENSVAESVQLLAWDDGPAWKLKLGIAKTADEKQWALSGQLVRREQVEELSRPLALIKMGLVIFPDRIARFDPAGHFPWIVSLREQNPLLIPVKEQDQFVEQLLQLPRPPELELPPDLRWQEERPTPVPRLRVSKSKDWGNRLECALAFQYGERSVASDDPGNGWFDRKARQAVYRDRAAERAAEHRLLAAGARSEISYFGHRRLWSVAPEKLPRFVTDLTDAGWQIEAEGSIIRPAGKFSMSVTSGIDWFDLEGGCDFGGIHAGLPQLLAALRRGEQFVRLDDGSQGLLPLDWLKRYAGWAELGQADGDRIRFLPTQAAFVDALLAAQEPQTVRIDQEFARLREKLRTFEGIVPAREGSTFVGQLRPYQREGLGWLHFLDEFGFGGCLADDMGLGKTVQMLALLDQHRQALRDAVTGELQDGAAAAPRPSLVVVPRSLVFNWIEEARRFTPNLRVLNYTGLDRLQALEQIDDSDLVVTTYGTLRRDIARLRTCKFDYAILDEAQAIKNASSQSAKACRLIGARRRLAMTGTPVENHLGELWSLFDFLNPGMLGRREGLAALISPGRRNSSRASQAGDDQPSADLTALRRALRPFLLRRTKDQVLADLPAKTEQTLYCELQKEERVLYDELREHYRATLINRVARFGLQKSKIHVLEALLRLRQAACHPGLLDKKKIDAGSAKLETLLAQLAEVIDEGHKALVFSQFTSLLAIVRAQLDRQLVTYEYLDGRTVKRQAKVERFQSDPDCRLFLISLKAGGQGLNLTAADYVFILDPWWNPAVEAQAVDRAHRIGQCRHVFAYRLIARETVEEKILKLQEQKRSLADAIITADNSIMRSLTAEDLQLLLS